ncbi:MAG: cytosine permease [Solimonas sp.]
MPSIRSLFARLVERSPYRTVGADDQRGWWFLVAIHVGVAICVPLFAFGGQLGRHMQFAELIAAVLCGALLTVVLATATGMIGMKARVPTAILVRRTFGGNGAKIVALTLIIASFGWFGVQTEMLVNSVCALLKIDRGAGGTRLALTIGAGALMSSTAIIGVRALGKVTYAAVPLLLIVIAVPATIALSRQDLLPLLTAAPAETAYGFGTVVSVVAGSHMSAVAISPDLTRFLRTPRDVVTGTFVSFAVALPVLLLLSALLAVVYGSADLVAVMVAAGVGAPALLVIVLATWTSNDKNLYESALSLSALFPRIERWQLTAIAALIGTAIACAGIFQHFIGWLILLGLAIAPVAGVYLVDYLTARQRYADDAVVVGLRLAPFAAWAGGSLFGWLCLPVESSGPGLLTLTSVPTLDALLFAGLLQALFIGAQRLLAHGRAAARA